MAARSFRGTDGERRWLLGLLMLINLFAYADRTVVGALGQAIKQDLKLSDMQLGLLNGFAFAIFYSVLGLPVARMAERRSRVAIIAVATFLWSIMSSLCGVAQNFTQLLLFRIGVGVGEAGFNPPVASLIGDYCKPGRRASAMAIVALGGSFGPAFGAMGGGLIADQGGWRWAFLIIAAPGLILAPLAWFTLREPTRGWADGAVHTGEPPSAWATFRYLFAKPAFRNVLIASALGAFVMNSFGQFTAPLFVRRFGLSFAAGGFYFGIVSSIAVTAGLLLSGFGSDWASLRDRRWQLWTGAIGVAIAGPCYVIALRQESPLALAVALTVALTGLFSYYTPSLASVQDMAEPRMRASASFVISFVTGLIGTGLGPVVTGRISDLLAARAYGGDFASACPGGRAVAAGVEAARACSEASATGLGEALMAILLLLPVSALFFFLAGRTLPRDTYSAGAVA